MAREKLENIVSNDKPAPAIGAGRVRQRSECPVCGARSVSSGVVCQTVFNHPQYFLRCPECETLFDQSPVVPEYAEGYYSDNQLLDFKLYLEKGASLRLFTHLVLTAERAASLATLNSKEAGKKGKFLEVGCGPGLLLDVARFRGWEPIGLEPNQETVKWGQETLNLPILRQMLGGHAPVSNASVALATEVIEHLDSPQEFLRALFEALAPSGVAVLTTPNASSQGLRRQGTSWVHLGMGYHLVLYSPRSLRQALLSAGFKTVEIWCFEGDDRLLAIASKSELPAKILQAVCPNFDEDKEAIEVCTQYLWNVRSRFESDENPYWQGCFYRLVDILVTAGDYEQALKVANDLQSVLHARGYTDKHVLDTLGEATEAKHRPLFYARVPTFVPNLHFLRGLALLHFGRIEEAGAEFHSAYQIAEKLEKLSYESYEELAGTLPSLTYLFHLGFASLKDGKPAEAVAAFEKMLSSRARLSTDTVSQLLMNEAAALREQKQLDAAANKLEELTSLGSSSDPLPPLTVSLAREKLLDIRLEEQSIRLEELRHQAQDLKGRLLAEQAMRHAVEAQLQYLRYRIADKINAFAKKVPLVHRVGKAALVGLKKTWRHETKKKLSLATKVRVEALPRPKKHIGIAPVARQTAELGVCTIIAKNYLSAARVLARSFKKHNPGCPFFVMIVDWVDQYFDPTSEEFLTIELDQVEIPNKAQLLLKYSVLEASTAVKPYLLEHLFAKHDLKKLIYLDPDILVTNSFAELSQMLDQHSIVLTPHMTSPVKDNCHPGEFEILQAGTFNLGFIAVRKSATTHALLRWWQSKLQDQCYLAPEKGMHVDQKWMDLAPGLFGDTFVLREPGYNIAYWNLHERQVKSNEDDITVNGNPTYFFHFSGFDPRNLEGVSKHQNRFRIGDIGQARKIFEQYREQVLEAGWEESQSWPYSHNYFDNGIRIPAAARWLYASLGDSASTFGDPFETANVNGFWQWLNQPVDGETDASRVITRLWREIYERRPDLRAAYPDYLGADRDGLLEWIRNTGRSEASIDRHFLPHDTPSAGQEGQADTVPFGMNVMGYANSEKGMGEAVRSDIRILEAAKIPYVVNSIVDIFGAKNVEILPPAVISDRNPFAFNLFHVNADQVPEITAQHRSRFAGHYNIGYWTWELAEFPKKWKDCFEPFDEIWVPSNFVKKAVQAISPIPVTVVPHALNPDLSMSPGLTRETLGIGSGSFVFMFFFDFYSYAERKNPLGVVEAFKRAFGERTDVILFIKSGHEDFDAPAYEALKRACDAPNIRLFTRILTRGDVNRLLSLCDCYVSLHRSEGFGLTLSEAMHMGKPVIATGYSGNMDFMREGNSFLVQHRLVELTQNFGPYKRGSVWAEPDLDHAASVMRHVTEDREHAAKVAEQGRCSIIQQLHPSVIGTGVRERLQLLAADRDWIKDPSETVGLKVAHRPEINNYLEHVQRNWDQFGRTDPMYWILTVPEKKGNRWDPEEFFKTGRTEIEQLLADISKHGMSLKFSRVLDFGCGVGRLTQALAPHFEECHGVDISPSMIEKAKQNNRFGTKCTYHLNASTDLSLFPDEHFDLIYSSIALQHVHPVCSRCYLAEFVRVLRPGGVVVFQLPSEAADLSLRREHKLAANGAPQPAGTIEMHGIPRGEVIDILESAGAKVQQVEIDRLAGEEWISFRYFAMKMPNLKAASSAAAILA